MSPITGAYPTRALGRNGPLVPCIGFGAMSIGGVYGQTTAVEDKYKVLDHAHAIGARFWDTADVYYDSEQCIGEWLRRNPEKRADIFLATKFGLDYSTGVQVERTDPQYVREACEKSLKVLSVDAIDLYYIHRVDGKTPIEKTIQAMVELKNEGKIKHLGLSECSVSTIRRAHAVHPIAAYQVDYSAFTRNVETNGVLATCRELGIAVVAHSPVGRGLLTGQVRSFDDLPAADSRRATPKFSPENFPKILALVAEFEGVAAGHGATPAQACLAWLLRQGDDIIPIPGTRTPRYLDENMAAAALHLTDDEVRDLRKRAEETDLVGSNFPDFMAGPVGADTPALEAAASA